MVTFGTYRTLTLRGREDAAKAINTVMRFGEFGSTLLAAARGDGDQA